MQKKIGQEIIAYSSLALFFTSAGNYVLVLANKAINQNPDLSITAYPAFLSILVAGAYLMRSASQTYEESKSNVVLDFAGPLNGFLSTANLALLLTGKINDPLYSDATFAAIPVISIAAVCLVVANRAVNSFFERRAERVTYIEKVLPYQWIKADADSPQKPQSTRRHQLPKTKSTHRAEAKTRKAAPHNVGFALKAPQAGSIATSIRLESKTDQEFRRSSSQGKESCVQSSRSNTSGIIHPLKVSLGPGTNGRTNSPK